MIEMRPFVCKGCLETITKPENFSKEPSLCYYCWREREAVNNNKCLSCGGKNPEAGYWGTCKKCFEKPQTDKEFEEALDLEEIRNEFGWEAEQDYLDRKREKKK